MTFQKTTLSTEGNITLFFKRARESFSAILHNEVSSGQVAAPPVY